MPRLQPADLELLDTASHVVSTSVDVPATRAELWKTFVDNNTWSEWYEDCAGCDAEPDIWEASGNTRRIRIGILRADETAVVIEPEERWGFTITATNVFLAKRMVEVVEFIDTSREGEVRTEIRWTGAFDPLFLTRPIAGLIAQRAIDAWGQSFENLSEYVAERR
ncbi:MAG: SRPBCC family protein [Acidimicrobiales bacterium]